MQDHFLDTDAVDDTDSVRAKWEVWCDNEGQIGSFHSHSDAVEHKKDHENNNPGHSVKVIGEQLSMNSNDL